MVEVQCGFAGGGFHFRVVASGIDSYVTPACLQLIERDHGSLPIPMGPPIPQLSDTSRSLLYDVG